MKVSLQRSLLTAALFATCWMVRDDVMGQSSLALELQETKTHLEYTTRRLKEVELQLAQAQAQAATYGENLAATNDDLQQTREAYNQLRIQMEGLGVAALDPSNSELQQRYLTSLSDLRILEQQKRLLADALLALSESSLTLSRNGLSDAERILLEQRLEQAEKALAHLRENVEEDRQGELHHAAIVSMNEDIGIAVLNVGLKHGVHPGMPFSIFRQDKPIARALVVDVRGGVCGAIIQELVNHSDPVKVGDVGKVETANKG